MFQKTGMYLLYTFWQRTGYHCKNWWVMLTKHGLSELHLLLITWDSTQSRLRQEVTRSWILQTAGIYVVAQWSWMTVFIVLINNNIITILCSLLGMTLVLKYVLLSCMQLMIRSLVILTIMPSIECSIISTMKTIIIMQQYKWVEGFIVINFLSVVSMLTFMWLEAIDMTHQFLQWYTINQWFFIIIKKFFIIIKINQQTCMHVPFAGIIIGGVTVTSIVMSIVILLLTIGYCCYWRRDHRIKCSYIFYLEPGMLAQALQIFIVSNWIMHACTCNSWYYIQLMITGTYMQELEIELDFVHDMDTSDPLPNMANQKIIGYYVSYDCLKQTSDNAVSQLKAAFGEDSVVIVGEDEDQSRWCILCRMPWIIIEW